MKYITDIAFDVDNTIRDTYKILEKKFNFKIKSYNYVYKGKTFWQQLETVPNLFKISLPTKYYRTIIDNTPAPIMFWTVQKKEFEKQTTEWLDKWIGKKRYKVQFFRSSRAKYKYLKEHKHYFLVEDTSEFPEYARVLLIDQLYNRHIKDCTRITKVSELKKIIKGVYK